MSNSCYCEVMVSGKDRNLVDRLIRRRDDNESLTMSNLVPEPYNFINSSRAYLLDNKDYENRCKGRGTKFKVSNYKDNYDYIKRVITFEEYKDTSFADVQPEEKDYKAMIVELTKSVMKDYLLAGCLDMVDRDMDWFTWRRLNWGVTSDIEETVYVGNYNYCYITPWQANVTFWKNVTKFYDVEVIINEDECSDCLFNIYTVNKGSVIDTVSFANELDFRREVENLTDIEFAETVLDKYECLADFKDSYEYRDDESLWEHIDVFNWQLVK